MKSAEVEDYARRLLSAHGDRAEAEAAQKVRECEERGDAAQAGDWRRIREVIRRMRGPNES
ncbi:MAG: hypothetical protein ACE5FS_12695 [Paracoccaceae bacterium]